MMMRAFIPLFLSLLPLTNATLSRATTAPAAHPNIIIQTCKRCADSSQNVNYTLCVTSLSLVPSSHWSKLGGLAVISVKLAASNATKALYKVKKLLKTRPQNPYTKSCLLTCHDLYTNGIMNLKDSIKAIKSGNYADANIWISTAVDAPMTCEDSFAEGNIKSLLEEEDKGFFQLAVIALGVAALLM